MPLVDRKIPILTGVNDVPTTDGDAKHPNASLLCANYNALIDDIPTEVQSLARQAISVTGDGATYDNTTGVINVTLTDTITNLETDISSITDDVTTIQTNTTNLANLVDTHKIYTNRNAQYTNNPHYINASQLLSPLEVNFAIQEIPIFYLDWNNNEEWVYPYVKVFDTNKHYIKLYKDKDVPSGVRPMSLRYKKYVSQGWDEIALYDYSTYAFPEFGAMSIDSSGVIDFNIGLNPDLIEQLDGITIDMLVYSEPFDLQELGSDTDIMITLLKLKFQSFASVPLADRVLLENLGSAPAYGTSLPAYWDLSWRPDGGGSGSSGSSGSGGSGSGVSGS